MKYIKKEKEPNSLKNYRSKQNSHYDNMPTEVKDNLRNSLLKEQGGICCYCMRRIKFTDMKIEHWIPRSIHPNLTLTYTNLLGACDGYENGPKLLRCCDTKKGNDIITINPLDLRCEDLIKYTYDGKIYSDDFKINEDINVRLNLNMKILKNNRAIVIDELLKRMQQKYGRKEMWTIADISKEMNLFKTLNSEGKYIEYCQIALFFLNKMLKKKKAIHNK